MVLNKNLKLRQKMVRAEHRLILLESPTGLRVNKEIKLMDAPGPTTPNIPTISNILLKAEQEICKAMSDYHRKIRDDTREEHNSIDTTLQENMDRGTVDTTPVVG